MAFSDELVEMTVLRLATSSPSAMLKLKTDGIDDSFFVHKEEGKPSSITKWLYGQALKYHADSGGYLLTKNVLGARMVDAGKTDQQREKMLLLWSRLEDLDADENDLHMLVEQMKTRRFSQEFQETVTATTKALQGEGGGPEACVEELRKRAFELDSIMRGKGTEDSRDYTKSADFIRRMVVAARSDEGSVGILSGFKWLDDATFGFQPDELCVFVAPSGGGKSTQLLNVAIHAHDIQGKNVLYFSLELGPVKTLRRHSACQFGISHNDLKSGAVSDAELERLVKGVEALAGGAYFLYDYRAKDVTADYIDQRIQQVTFERGKPNLVVVDYIGIMKGAKTRANAPAFERVGDAVEELVEVGKRRGVPILTAAQFNRTGMAEKRNAKAKSKAFEYAQDMISGDSRLVHYASMVIGVDPDVVEKTNAYYPIKMRDGSFVPFITKYDIPTFRILDVGDDDQENWRALQGILASPAAAGIHQTTGESSSTTAVVDETSGLVTLNSPSGSRTFAPDRDMQTAASDWDFE